MHTHEHKNTYNFMYIHSHTRTHVRMHTTITVAVTVREIKVKLQERELNIENGNGNDKKQALTGRRWRKNSLSGYSFMLTNISCVKLNHKAIYLSRIILIIYRLYVFNSGGFRGNLTMVGLSSYVRGGILSRAQARV